MCAIPNKQNIEITSTKPLNYPLGLAGHFEAALPLEFESLSSKFKAAVVFGGLQAGGDHTA
jgi:hypothetical protein